MAPQDEVRDQVFERNEVFNLMVESAIAQRATAGVSNHESP
jgi:hypothetical protein